MSNPATKLWTPALLLVLLASGCVRAQRVSTEGFSFQPQPGWVSEPAASEFRAAQYRLIGEAGDASLVVYHFGTDGGGTVQANIDRWCGQFEQPDGRASRDAATIDHRQVGPLHIDTIDLSGTYVAETRPGSGEHLNEPDHRLLAAIIPTGAGPYYVKLIGPIETVTAWAGSYEAFLRSLAPSG